MAFNTAAALSVQAGDIWTAVFDLAQCRSGPSGVYRGFGRWVRGGGLSVS